jgi:hypothetical protein
VVGPGPASSASPAVILSHCASNCPDWNPSSPYPASHPWYPPPADSRGSAIQGGAIGAPNSGTTTSVGQSGTSDPDGGANAPPDG